MKIAMFGIKGIPVPGGAENVVEQIGSRLVRRGHEVIVYVRPQYTPPQIKTYHGMSLTHLPSIPTKNLDAISHSFLASLACMAKKPDIVHIHATGNSIYALVPKLRGIPTVVQSHGLDWQRAKWGELAKAYLKMTDYTTVRFPTITTAVSRKMQCYYQEKFHQPVVYIPNGVASCQKVAPHEILSHGLKGNDYIFFASRLVPEKGCHYLIQAYKSLCVKGKKLVIAGDGSYNDPYTKEIKKNADENILFLGFVQGQLLKELLSNAYLYVLPSEVEGISTGLLEAMSYGNCVLVSDIEENVEAIGDAGLTFKSGSCDDLAVKMQVLLQNETLVECYRYLAKRSANEKYDWESVTDLYEALYQCLLIRNK